jgi:hypothetical protein
MALRAVDLWQAAAKVEDDTPVCPTFAMRLAARNGNVVVLEVLLKGGAKVALVEERTDGDAPLMFAARKGAANPMQLASFRLACFEGPMEPCHLSAISTCWFSRCGGC